MEEPKPPGTRSVEAGVEAALLHSLSSSGLGGRGASHCARSLDGRLGATVPEFTFNVPVFGNRWAVGVAFSIHILVVAFIIGIAMVAPVAELLGMRAGGGRWEKLAHQLAESVGKLFAWGATWAAFALVMIWGLYPRLWGYLATLFFVETIIIAGLLWFVMTISAYVYYLTWERPRNRKLLHNTFGWIFVLFTMLFINTIIVWDTHQLTPTGGPTDLLAAAINPSYTAEFPHRHIGNLSYGPLIVAAYVGLWSLLFWGGRRFDEGEWAYHQWLGDVMLLIGLSVILLQPIAGWFYVNQIFLASPGAWAQMMVGPSGWKFRMMIGLLGGVIFFGNLYMLLGMRRGIPRPAVITWMKVSLVLLALDIGLAVLPKDVPLGLMNPWKYVALATYMLITLANLVIYIRARSTFTWGRRSRLSWATLAFIGGLIMALFVTMGSIRETARSPYLIYDQMGPDQAQELVRP